MEESIFGENIKDVNVELIQKEINELTKKESEIQNKIDNHITDFLDCIRRKI